MVSNQLKSTAGAEDTKVLAGVILQGRLCLTLQLCIVGATWVALGGCGVEEDSKKKGTDFQPNSRADGKGVDEQAMTWVVGSDHYVMIPPGKSAKEMATWLNEVMSKPPSPNAPAPSSPWVPEFKIWGHFSGLGMPPSSLYMIVANGQDLYLGKGYTPSRLITHTEILVFRRIMRESGSVLSKYEECTAVKEPVEGSETKKKAKDGDAKPKP